MRSLVILLCLSSLARAESRPDALAPLRVDAATLDKTYRRARAKRNIGIALAVPGVASSLLAVVLAAYAANAEPNLNAIVGEGVASGATGLAGLALGIPGIYLWMTGQDDMDVVKWRRAQLLPLVSLRKDGGVAGFSINF